MTDDLAYRIGFNMQHIYQDAATEAIRSFGSCESPIEKLLGSALVLAHEIYRRENLPVIDKLADQERGTVRALIPQYRMGGYRIDFALSVPPVFLLIECDGHDFHEKTKEQAAKDRLRDRTVQFMGFPIFRFTGSEIYRAPVNCSMEILRFVEAEIKRAKIDTAPRSRDDRRRMMMMRKKEARPSAVIDAGADSRAVHTRGPDHSAIPVRKARGTVGGAA